MDFVQDLGGGCPSDSSSHQLALWYGWRPSSPGFDVLHNFWHALPTTPCNHRQAYATWLDTPFAPSGVVPEVAQLQAHVVNDHQLPFRVITEAYSQSQLLSYGGLYAPFQTVVTGYSGAPTTADWASHMCMNWRAAGQPGGLGVWTYADRDVPPLERYGALIGGSLPDVTSVCADPASRSWLFHAFAVQRFDPDGPRQRDRLR
jgi:hypothetical protein